MCKVPTVVGVQMQADVVFVIVIAATTGIVIDELLDLVQMANSVAVELQMRELLLNRPWDSARSHSGRHAPSRGQCEQSGWVSRSLRYHIESVGTWIRRTIGGG